MNTETYIWEDDFEDLGDIEQLLTEGVTFEEIVLAGNKKSFWYDKAELIYGKETEETELFYHACNAEAEFYNTLSEEQRDQYLSSNILTEETCEDYENWI